MCVIGGLDYWTGLLDWTELAFEPKFNHKNQFELHDLHVPMKERDITKGSR